MIAAAVFIVNSTNVKVTKIKISKSLGIGSARYCANKENISTSNASTELCCIGKFHFTEHNPVAVSGNALHSTSVSELNFLQAKPGQTIVLDFKFKDSHLQESYDVFHASVQNIHGNVTINPFYSYIYERKW